MDNDGARVRCVRTAAWQAGGVAPGLWSGAILRPRFGTAQQMSPTPEDAQLGVVPAELIPQLAVLYDRFANALDPFAPKTSWARLPRDYGMWRVV